MIVSWILSALIGFSGGVLGGLFGIGGGILIVPALVFIFGMKQFMAQGTSLLALLAPVGLLGVYNYYKSGNLEINKGVFIAIGFFLGTFLGSKIALMNDENIVRKAFSLFLIGVGIILFFKK